MSKIKNNSAIDFLMGNINDAIGTTSQFGKFAFDILLEEDHVIDMICVRDVSDVLMSIVLVSKHLMALAK
jgi:hypothetical protein